MPSLKRFEVSIGITDINYLGKGLMNRLIRDMLARIIQGNVLLVFIAYLNFGADRK
ncbi:MAG: hypothetical protein AAF327_18475 [Cyanobacteria bacterium P01_A01_bin.37]